MGIPLTHLARPEGTTMDTSTEGSALNQDLGTAGEGGSREAGQKNSKSDKEITVSVFAPNTTEAKTFTWEKTMKVGDAARQAATAFGYTGGNPGLQTADAQARVLQNNKPLVAEKVGDGDELELIDTGGGV
jgi:hypothetical protein